MVNPISLSGSSPFPYFRRLSPDSRQLSPIQLQNFHYIISNFLC